MEAPRKSVRISTRVSTIEIPSWDDDDDDEPEVCSSNDNSLDDVLEQKVTYLFVFLVLLSYDNI